MQLYEKFVCPCELKLNQLQLVLIAAQVASQLMPSRPSTLAGAHVGGAREQAC